MSLLPAAARTPISPFAWAGRFGMVVGLALGIYIYPYWNFHHIIYTSMALGALALVLIPAVKVPFRAPLQHFMVLAGPFFAAAHFVAGDEYDDGGHYLWDIGGTYLQ